MRSRVEHFLFLDGRIPWLDGLRAFAVLMVVARHVFDRPFVQLFGRDFRPHGIAASMLFSNVSMGWAGVFVFFLISGFLVGGGVILDARRERFSAPAFLAKRYVRVFIPAIIFLFIYRFHREGSFPIMEAIYNVLFVATYANAGWLDHYWSLDVEAHFYVIVSILGVVIMHSKRAALADDRLGKSLLWGGFGFAVVKIVSAVAFPDLNFFKFTHWTLDFFAAGTGLGLLYESDAWRSEMTSRRSSILTVSAVLFFSGAAVVIGGTGELFWFQRVAVDLTLLLLLILGGVCLFLACFTGRIGKVFNWLPFRIIGAISFSIYLVHLPIVVWFAERPMLIQQIVGDHGPIAAYLLLFTSIGTASLIGGTGFYLAVERPILIVRRLLIPGIPKLVASKAQNELLSGVKLAKLESE